MLWYRVTVNDSDLYDALIFNIIHYSYYLYAMKLHFNIKGGLINLIYLVWESAYLPVANSKFLSNLIFLQTLCILGDFVGKMINVV